ncbi:hypothetical protein ISCGN_029879 [Ixodes scapularis]
MSATVKDESAHFEGCGGMPASSLPLEGQCNGTFAVKEEQREECAIPISPAWHCGDADDLFTSHGNLHVEQNTFVLVKKEPEDVSSTSADGNLHSYDRGDLSVFPPQLAGYGDGVILVKEEPEGVPATSAGESVLPDDGGSMFECQPQLERHRDSATAVGEEPTDVEWRCSNDKESSSSSAQERWDQGQQEEQGGSKGHDCRFCPFSNRNVHPKKRKTHRYCCVIDCHNNEGTPNVSLYRFPSQPWDRERRQRWIAAVGRVNPDGSPWAPNDGSRICSAHFVNNEKSNIAIHPAYCPTLFPRVYKKNSTIPQDQVSRFDRWHRRRARRGGSTMVLAKLPKETPATSRNERGRLEDGSGTRASSLHLEGQWNCAFAVKREQDEGSAISISEAWHSGDTDYLSFSHGHLFASQTTSVLVKKEPEDVPPPSAGESVHFDGYGIMSECPLQLEGHRDTGAVAIKEEPNESAFLWTGEGSCTGAPDGASSSLIHPSGLWMGGRRSTTEVPEEILPTPTGAGFPTKDVDGVLPSHLDLEGHWSDRAVKEEADEEPAGSTTEGPDGGDAVGLFASRKPKKEVQTATPVVKEELANAEWDSSSSEESSNSSSSEEQFNQIRRNIREKSRHKCRFCPLSSISKICITQHEKTHLGEQPFSCNVCQKEFISERGLNIHAHCHRSRAHFRCSACPQVFLQESDLCLHQRIHTGEHKKFGTKCFSTTLASVKMSERRFKCPTCPKAFFTKWKLKVHAVSHVEERPFKCSACPKKFRRKCNLDEHERTHTDKNCFKCPNCPKAFATKWRLSNHEKTHSTERPFTCPTCPKRFRKLSCLTNHERVHTGERPFKCAVCHNSFRTKNNLAVHQKVHTDKNCFQCPTCPRAFKVKWRLTNHEKETHPKEALKCPKCPAQSFRTKRHLSDHERTHRWERPPGPVDCL